MRNVSILMDMSIFIAFTIPQDSIVRIRESMRLYQDSLVQSVSQDKWHCTMLYLGDISLPQEALISFMKPVRQTFHPVVKVLSLGQGKAAHQLWAYVQPSQLLDEIRLELQERAQRTGIFLPEGSREFIPHINVGNLQEQTGAIAIPDAPVSTHFSLRELVILKSNPSEPNAPYEQLGIIPVTP